MSCPRSQVLRVTSAEPLPFRQESLWVLPSPVNSTSGSLGCGSDKTVCVGRAMFYVTRGVVCLRAGVTRQDYQLGQVMVGMNDHVPGGG